MLYIKKYMRKKPSLMVTYLIFMVKSHWLICLTAILSDSLSCSYLHPIHSFFRLQATNKEHPCIDFRKTAYI